MNRFMKWTEDRRGLAKSYKGLLQNVPQDPTHHPEGDVLAHVKLVRKSIPKAIAELQRVQTDQENSLAVAFSEIDFSISRQEGEILALAAWLHDIGKRSATTVGGEPWDQSGVSGKIQSIGHQDSKHYEPAIQGLEKDAPPQTKELYLQNRELVNWLVEHHMDLSAGQFSKKFMDEHFDGGKVRNSQQMRLLLVLMWADKMGRDPETTLNNLAKMSQKMVHSAGLAQKRLNRRTNHPPSTPAFQGNPSEFIALLKQRGLHGEFLAKNIRNKFPQLSDQEVAQLTAESFVNFMEAVQPTVIDEQIPMKPEELQDCLLLKKLLGTQQLYMVGGGVRDYLFYKLHGKGDGSPKDIDLATDVSEEEILQRLRTHQAQAAGVRVNEKESVDTFGVVFANVDGRDYEIAPFRKDVGSVDGRRPERVERAGIEEDAMRRDLTMNNLYYDFENQKIIDLNPNGQGVEDIKNKVTRPVGDPFERFEEDKLRVLRLVRFFSRFNDGDIREFLDERTQQAIQHFIDLPGVTPERVVQEFLAGLNKSLSTTDYLKNYVNLGLLDRVFPGLQVDVAGIDRLGNSKNPKVVLAWMLRGNKNIAQALNKLKYSNEISDPVGFYVGILNGMETMQMVKGRSRWLAKAGGSQQMSQDLQELAQVSGRSDLQQLVTYLAGQGGQEGEEEWAWKTQPYEPPKISGDELMQQGIPQGPELGQEIARRQKSDYESRWKQFLNQKSLSPKK